MAVPRCSGTASLRSHPPATRTATSHHHVPSSPYRYDPLGNPIILLGLTNSVPEVIEVCPVDELAPGEMRLVEWKELEIGVFNCAGTVYAIEDRCSHDNGPL